MTNRNRITINLSRQSEEEEKKTTYFKQNSRDINHFPVKKLVVLLLRGIKIHACDPNMPHLLAITLMNN